MDVGCGPGKYISMFESMGYYLSGIDFSKEMIRKAKSESEAVHFVVGDAYSLPYKDASFDLVLNMSVLQTMSDEKRAIVEISRVLVPKQGILLLETLNSFEIFHFIESILTFSRKPCFSRRFSYFKLKKLLGDTGFTEIEISLILVFPRLVFLEKILNKVKQSSIFPLFLILGHYLFITAIKK